MPIAYQIHKQEAVYFLTLQVVYWIDIFSRKNYRDIVIDNLNHYAEHKGLVIYSYVMMSNHLHLMVRAEQKNLSDVIRDFKSQTSQKIIKEIETIRESRKNWMLKLFGHAASKHERNEKYQVWTHENHAIELHNNRMILQRIQYTHQNPVRAGIVQKEEHYLYSSARDYHNKEGKVKIEKLNLHLMMSEMSFTQYGLKFNY